MENTLSNTLPSGMLEEKLKNLYQEERAGKSFFCIRLTALPSEMGEREDDSGNFRSPFVMLNKCIQALQGCVQVASRNVMDI